VTIARCDACYKLFERQFRFRDWHHYDPAVPNRDINRGIFTKLRLFREWAWDAKRKAVAPLLDSCLHGGIYKEYTAGIPFVRSGERITRSAARPVPRDWHAERASLDARVDVY
jgi:hypothetical protein